MKYYKMLILQKKKFNIIVTLLVILTIVSCKKENINKIEYFDSSTLNSWHLDSTFQFEEKNQLNIFNINDSQAVIANNESLRLLNGNNSYYDLSGKGGATNYNILYYLILNSNNSNTSIYTKPYLSKYFYVGINPTGFNIYSIYAATSGNFKYSSPYPAETQKYGFGYIGSLWNAISFMTDSSFVYSYTYKSDDSNNDTLKSALLTFNRDWQGVPQLKNQVTLSIPLGKNGTINGARPFSYSFLGYTYLLIGQKIFRIDMSGNYTDLTNPSVKLNNVVSMFTVGKYIFAIGDDQQSLTISEDNGISWHIFSSGINSYLSLLQFCYINGKTIGYHNSQIFELSLKGNTLNIKELENSGLATNQITGISQAGRHIFASTMSGVYYRDTSHFITYK